MAWYDYVGGAAQGIGSVADAVTGRIRQRRADKFEDASENRLEAQQGFLQNQESRLAAGEDDRILDRRRVDRDRYLSNLAYAEGGPTGSINLSREDAAQLKSLSSGLEDWNEGRLTPSLDDPTQISYKFSPSELATRETGWQSQQLQARRKAFDDTYYGWQAAGLPMPTISDSDLFFREAAGVGLTPEEALNQLPEDLRNDVVEARALAEAAPETQRAVMKDKVSRAAELISLLDLIGPQSENDEYFEQATYIRKQLEPAMRELYTTQDTGPRWGDEGALTPDIDSRSRFGS